MMECRCQLNSQPPMGETATYSDSDDFVTEIKTARMMKDERRRLMSYSRWPPSSCQQPERLAEAGFFYTETTDRVKCAFCLGVLKNWLPDDAPFDEHKKHFPYCKFTRGKDVGNTPLRQPRDDAGNISFRHTGIEQVLENGVTWRRLKERDDPRHQETIQNAKTGASRTAPITNSYIQNLPVQSERKGFLSCNFNSSIKPVSQSSNVTSANYPSQSKQNEERPSSSTRKQSQTTSKTTSVDYTHEDNRLVTFLGWPGDSELLPEDLARAGFYFVPTEVKPDRVKCGYCGGKLYGWQEGDEPMVEHARCFPACPYVKLCVGEDKSAGTRKTEQILAKNNDRSSSNKSCNHVSGSGKSIEKAQDERSNAVSPPLSAERTRTFRPDVSSTCLDISTNRVDDGVTVGMRSEAVQAVLAMGFPKEKVIQTVREKILKGDNVFVVQELVDTLL